MQRISVNGIDIESIISDYFNEVPPFEAKKPEEFKDAIAAKSITQYCHNHEKDTVVCVITKDKGFAKAFDGEKIQLYDDLNNFLDMMTTLLDNRTRALRSFIDSGNADEEIYYKIKRHIERIEFFSAETTDDFEIIDISHINFKTLYIHNLDPASAVIEIEISAIIKSWSNTIDEDRSYFDKEEGQYLWKLEFEKEETHKIEVYNVPID